jgi:hypothetical protein
MMRQEGISKANASEPPMKCRKAYMALLPWMWVGGVWYGRVPGGWGARA